MPPDHAAEVMTFVAANVRRLREQLDVTQEELAARANLDVTYVQRIERGRANVTLRILVALADVLEVRPAALLRRSRMRAPVRGRPRKK